MLLWRYRCLAPLRHAAHDAGLRLAPKTNQNMFFARRMMHDDRLDRLIPLELAVTSRSHLTQVLPVAESACRLAVLPPIDQCTSRQPSGEEPGG